MESHEWLSTVKAILLSAMASVDGGNRLLAAQALAQLCVVGEIAKCWETWKWVCEVSVTHSACSTTTTTPSI